MQAVLEPRSEDADHALVPVGREERRLGLRLQRFQLFQRLLEHAAFDLAPLAVQPVELARAVGGARLVVGDQAFDAEAHVGEPAGGIEARPGDEAEVEARGFGHVASSGAQQRGEAGLRLCGANAMQALRHEIAVVRIQRHHVGDGAKRHEIGECTEVHLGLQGAAPSQLGAQRDHHVEHHADAGQRFGWERASRLVRIDDAVGRGQLGARQVVIGDQRADAERARAGHAFDARDAIVHGDQQIGFSVRGEIDQLGRQAIAELEAVGHEVVDVRAEEPQRAHADRAGGRAIDQEPLTALDRIGEQSCGLAHAFQERRRQQPGRAVGELGRRADAPRGVDPGEQRMDAGIDQRAAIDVLVGALDDLHA